MKSCRNDNFGETSFCHNENNRGYMWLQMCLHEIIGCQVDFIFMFQSLVSTLSCFIGARVRPRQNDVAVTLNNWRRLEMSKI